MRCVRREAGEAAIRGWWQLLASAIGTLNAGEGSFCTLCGSHITESSIRDSRHVSQTNAYSERGNWICTLTCPSPLWKRDHINTSSDHINISIHIYGRYSKEWRESLHTLSDGKYWIYRLWVHLTLLKKKRNNQLESLGKNYRIKKKWALYKRAGKKELTSEKNSSYIPEENFQTLISLLRTVLKNTGPNKVTQDKQGAGWNEMVKWWRISRKLKTLWHTALLWWIVWQYFLGWLYACSITQ